MKLKFLKYFILGILMLCIIKSHGQKNNSPNIVIFFIDDLGYNDVGFNGSKDIPTPSIDKLANQGIKFSSAYVTHPFCGPSRMSLLTGRYPHFMGAQNNLPNYGVDAEYGIPTNEYLLSELLKNNGYNTAAIGKWHMGMKEQFHPNNRGFDYFYGFLRGAHKYFPSEYIPLYEEEKSKGTVNINPHYLPMDKNGLEYQENEYLTDAFTREAKQYIKQYSKDSNPFFIYLAYSAPHAPLEAKSEDLSIPEIDTISDEKRKIYAAMVYAVDRGVGEITKTLKEEGVFDNTLIIFLSDNGGNTNEGARNYPLNGKKGEAWEGGFRVPMFITWSNKFAGNSTFNYPITSLDIYPTIAHITQSPIPSEKLLDGKNILENLESFTEPHRNDPFFALRHTQYSNQTAILNNEWKALTLSHNNPWKLFDLHSDISETKNMADQYPNKLDTLVSLGKNWAAKHYYPYWFTTTTEKNNWINNGLPKYDLLFSQGDLNLNLPDQKGPIPLFAEFEINPPTNLSYIFLSEGSVKLTWVDNSNNEKYFIIEKSSGKGFEKLATSTSNEYIYNLPKNNETLQFRITAMVNGRYSTYSNLVKILPLPTPPYDLRIQETTSTQLEISWSDSSEYVDNYIIERNSNNILKIDTVNNSKQFYYEDIVYNKDYSFTIYSINARGKSARSNVDYRTKNVTPANPTNLSIFPVTDEILTLTWNDNSDNENEFRIILEDENNLQIKTLRIAENINTITDTLTYASICYKYMIQASNEIGNSDFATARYCMNEVLKKDGTDNNFQIFPNPCVTNKFFIKSSLINKNLISIELFDITGKIINTKTDQNQSENICQIEIISNQVLKGVYLIKIYTGFEIVSKRIILR